MKRFLTIISILSFVSLPIRADDPENTPERLAKGTYRASLAQLVIVARKEKPEERLVVLFTGFTNASATYKWLYFNPLSAEWITGNGVVQEVYDRVSGAEGVTRVVPVPGHSSKIEAGAISIDWSGGSDVHGWLYFSPSRLTIQARPAEEFDTIR